MKSQIPNNRKYDSFSLYEPLKSTYFIYSFKFNLKKIKNLKRLEFYELVKKVGCFQKINAFSLLLLLDMKHNEDGMGVWALERVELHELEIEYPAPGIADFRRLGGFQGLIIKTVGDSLSSFTTLECYALGYLVKIRCLILQMEALNHCQCTLFAVFLENLFFSLFLLSLLSYYYCYLPIFILLFNLLYYYYLYYYCYSNLLQVELNTKITRLKVDEKI